MLKKGNIGRLPKKKITPLPNGEYVLKPHIIPEDMVVIIDTREQLPLWLPKPPNGLAVVRSKLDNGDYSIRGFENKFAIERKSNDIFAYLTGERPKTKEKLIRLLDYEFKALVIEYEEEELYMPHFFTDVPPEVIRQSLVSFEIKYGLHIFYGSKKAIERKVLDWMIYYWKIKRSV
jgi:ERCC4-type nuclease